MYLDHQSSICSSYDQHHDHDQYPSAISNGRWNYENNEELDLSMVSDASSMPNPYYYSLQEENEDQDCCRFNSCEKSSRNQPKKDIIKRMKMKDKMFYNNNYQSLDDTASSHPISHNLSIHEHEAIYSSNNASSELYSMESNARKQTFKGKSSTSVKKSYSRSSLK
ncbi:uncharacterized protein LOC124913092 [Impatiens glandulifera]|uniref:uncharacterized protein LOC124913092 n=1 Tax=Impatiens glandulifera TaxID=253017 RepID=UPI001FB0F2C2|nr:uncharacterized protein LOC124913092 [Impatiens glandulifera]